MKGAAENRARLQRAWQACSHSQSFDVAAIDFHAVFDGSPNAYMLLDRELRFVAANRAYLEVTGRRIEDLLGRRVTEVFPHGRMIASLERVLNTGQPDALATPIFDADGKVELILQRTVQVDEHNELLERLFTQAPGFIAYLRGSDHVFELTNDAFQQLIGHRAVIGKAVRDALPEVVGQGYIELLDRAFEHGEPFTGKTRAQIQRTQNGPLETVHVELAIQPILDQSGRAAGVIVQGSDVTEREEKLLEAERARAEYDERLQWLHSVLAQAPVAVTTLRGPSYIIEIANERVLENWGRERDVLGKPLLEAVPELRGQGTVERLDHVRASGKPQVNTEQHIRIARSKDGAVEDLYFNSVYQPIFDQTGQVDSVVVVASEVTAEVVARQRRDRSHAELEAIFDSFPEALYIADRTGIKRANAAARELLGYDTTLTAEALAGRTTRADTVVRHRDTGEQRTVRSSAAPIRLGEEIAGAVVAQIDITETVRAQDRLKSFVEASGITTWELDVVSGLLHLDAETSAAHRVPGELPLEEGMATVHAEDRPRVEAALRAAIAGESDGRYAAEYRVVDPLTKTERWLQARGRVMRDGSGRPLRLLGTLMDITSFLRTETEALQLASVLDATRDFVGISDLDGVPLFINEAGRNMMGLESVEAARKRRCPEFFVERERERVATEVTPTALAEGYWAGELHFRHFGSGEEIPILYTIFPLRDSKGRITSLASITRDLRATKAAEAERAQLLLNEKAAREQAEQANQAKDEFLAMVSHELRTPLSAMLGWLYMLRTGMVAPEKRTRALETVERNARSQSQLIEDLLDVSRILAGKLVLEKEPTEVASVVAAAVETVRPAAQHKGVELEVAAEQGGIVIGNARRLQQVVWNLLSNAVKFTPAAGKVQVRVEHTARDVEIIVSDTGAGMSAELLPFVFDRFRQADGGAARKAGGLGLGLSIARHLVDAHGGSISATSDGQGSGSTFTVRLPIADIPRRPSPIAPAPSLPPPMFDGMHVLVVDDEEDTLEYLRMLLERSHARVTEAKSAREALAAFERDRPDLIVSDIAMPVEDGYAFIQKLRALPEENGGRTPAVALTAHARKEDRTRAMRAGFQNYIAKPIEPEELLAVVASLMHNEHAPRA